MNPEEFLQYLEEVAIDIDTPFDVEKDFERACQIGSQAIRLILLRAIEFTDEMMQKIPEESKGEVEVYKKDYELWKAHMNSPVDIDIGLYPEANPCRIIDGESVIPCSDDEELTEDEYSWVYDDVDDEF